MTDIDINCGDFIISLAGRDSGRVFIVAGVADGEYLSIADGMLRSIEKPKKKKRKHVRRLDIPSYEGRMSNRAVAAKIKDVVSGLS